MNKYTEAMSNLPPRFMEATSYDASGFYESYAGPTSCKYYGLNSSIQRPNTFSRVLYYVFRALWGFNVALSDVLSLLLDAMGLHEAWAAMQSFLFLLVVLNVLNYCPIWLFFVGTTVTVFYLVLFRRMKKWNPNAHFV